jgi:hypothetical protein
VRPGSISLVVRACLAPPSPSQPQPSNTPPPGVQGVRSGRLFVPLVSRICAVVCCGSPCVCVCVCVLVGWQGARDLRRGRPLCARSLRPAPLCVQPLAPKKHEINTQEKKQDQADKRNPRKATARIVCTRLYACRSSLSHSNRVSKSACVFFGGRWGAFESEPAHKRISARAKLLRSARDGGERALATASAAATADCAEAREEGDVLARARPARWRKPPPPPPVVVVGGGGETARTPKFLGGAAAGGGDAGDATARAVAAKVGPRRSAAARRPLPRGERTR